MDLEGGGETSAKESTMHEEGKIEEVTEEGQSESFLLNEELRKELDGGTRYKRSDNILSLKIE